MSHSTAAVVQEVDLRFQNIPKDHIHKEDPQEEVPAASVSSRAKFMDKIQSFTS